MQIIIKDENQVLQIFHLLLLNARAPSRFLFPPIHSHDCVFRVPTRAPFLATFSNRRPARPYSSNASPAIWLVSLSLYFVPFVSLPIPLRHVFVTERGSHTSIATQHTTTIWPRTPVNDDPGPRCRAFLARLIRLKTSCRPWQSPDGRKHPLDDRLFM